MDVSETAERFTDPCTFHGEGPFWDAANERLLLVDMLAGAVVEVDADGGTQRRQVATVAAALRARRSGGYVLATENRFLLLGRDLTEETALPPVFTDPLLRMNDGGCDPQGRFYCGTMAYAETPGAGTLYRLDPDGTVHVTLREVTISNGLQWNRVGDTVFYADTPTGRVDSFDFDPAGRLDLVVDLPVSNVTACAFGGPDLRTLFITTSRQGLDPEDQPDAGAVFRYEAGVRGAPQHAFAG